MKSQKHKKCNEFIDQNNPYKYMYVTDHATICPYNEVANAGN